MSRIFLPIGPSQLAGAITVNIFALLAAVALASVLIRGAWLAIRITWFKASPTQTQEVVFFHTQLGNYASCLVIGLFFNTIAGIIGFQWLVQHGVTDGLICRIQVLFMQMGNFSTGYFTVAIAVHTFNSLVMQRRQSVIICRSTITIGWFFTILVAVIPFFIKLSEGYIYGAAVMACGVRSSYPKLQFIFHLLPILVASLLGAILYSLIFLVLRGSLKLKSGVKLTLDPNARWHSSEGLTESYHRFIARVAKSMLWYPIAYIVFLIPYAATRLFMIAGFTVPFQAVVFASVCWYSLSVVDVVLLYNTFRVLGPAFDICTEVSTRRSMGSSIYFEKYGILDPNSNFKEKVQHYRSQSVSPPQSGKTLNTSSSYEGLLPLYLDRDASVDRSSSNETMLNRPIRTGLNGEWEIVKPLPVVTSPRYLNRQLSTHSRGESSSTLGLPVPPRQSRSALMTLPEPPRSAGGDEAETEQWLNHQRSTQTFGRQKSPISRSSSIYSDEGMISPQASTWSARQSLRHKNSVAVSTVTSNFPMHVASPTSPPTSATLEPNLTNYSTYRPLVLAHAPRSSSMDSQKPPIFF